MVAERGQRGGCREKSLQITGGRTWIRTRDLFLIREAPRRDPPRNFLGGRPGCNPNGLNPQERTSAELVRRQARDSWSQTAPATPSRTQFVCQRVVGGRFGGPGESSPGAISLQISGGPQGSRTPDLRRAKAALSQLS